MKWELLGFIAFDVWLLLKLVISYYKHRRLNLLIAFVVILLQGIYIMYL